MHGTYIISYHLRQFEQFFAVSTLWCIYCAALLSTLLSLIYGFYKAERPTHLRNILKQNVAMHFFKNKPLQNNLTLRQYLGTNFLFSLLC